MRHVACEETAGQLDLRPLSLRNPESSGSPASGFDSSLSRKSSGVCVLNASGPPACPAETVELVELVELVLSLPSAEAGRYPRERYPYPATDGGGQPTRSGLFGMVFVVARRLVVRACVVM